MYFPSVKSLITISTFVSAAFADYTPSYGNNGTEVRIAYVTKTIARTVTTCPKPKVITSCSSPLSSISASTSSGSSISSGSSVVSTSSTSSVSSSVSSGSSSVSSTSVSSSISVTSSSSVSSTSSSVSSSSGTSSSSVSSSSSISSSSATSTSSVSSTSSTSSSSVSSSTSTSQSSTSQTSTTSSSSSSSSSSSQTSSSQSSSSSTSSTSSSASSSSTSSSSSSTTSSTSSSTSSSSTSTSSTSSSSSSSTTSSSTSSSTTSTSSSSSSKTSTSTTSSSTTSTTSSTKTSSSSTSTSSTSSSTTSTSPTATACSYWMENIKHQGIAPFSSAPGTYSVFRNVKDFGAKGDGVTDDTVAINNAISSGGRCAPGTCASTSTTPALVYFPAGTYIVSAPIIDYYYTQIIGNPNCMPIIKATSSFTARWVIDGDEYVAGGAFGYGPTNVFWRQIRNFVIDISAIPQSVGQVAAIHWPTAQATSLQNIEFLMSSASGTQHQGVFIESGSGGFMTDLTFNGGFEGLFLANQQFTMRNLTFNNVVTAIDLGFDWGWTFKGITINNCQVGIDMSALGSTGALNVGSMVLIDSAIANTPVGILMARSATSTPEAGDSIIIENVSFNNVGIAVEGPGSTTALAGTAGQMTVAAWGQGNAYVPTLSHPTTPAGPTEFQGYIPANNRPASLTAGSDFYERSKPQYELYPASQFLSVRDAGAVGDGVHDDSTALINVLAKAASQGKIVYFDAGDYLVTKTIYVPSGSKIAGEAYPVILSSGSFFADMSNPQPVVQVGKPGEIGTVEWSDAIVSSKGAQAGAILIEWNLAAPTKTPAGMWDVHTRVGGFVGSDLQVAQCVKEPATTITTASEVDKSCIAAFMSMHVTKSATGLYMENCWLWTADHDVDDPALTQITIYSGRGLLIESVFGGIWLYGTAVEHHTLYQYQLSSTTDIFMGFIQTETPYYQPNPDMTLPFTENAAYNDPPLVPGHDAFGFRIVDSDSILVYGAGLYSFFDNYSTSCSDVGNGETCQNELFSIEKSSFISVYTLNTVGVTNMLTVDGTNVAEYPDNNDGFIGTIALIRDYYEAPI